MEKKLLEEINNIRSIMGIENTNIINESETRVLNNFKGDIINGPKYHQSRALGNWQSDNAWDLFAPAGTKWYSLTKGKVTKIKNTGKTTGKIYGTQVTVKGEDGYPDIFYTHLKNVSLNVGDKIEMGDKIGEVSEWGKSKGTHVHVGLPYGKHIKNLLSSDYSSLKNSKKTPQDIETDDGDFNISAEKAKSKDLNIDKKDDVASNGVKKTTSLDPRDELKNTIKQEIDKMKKMTNPTDDIKTAIKDLIKSLET